MTQPIGSPDWIKPLPGGAKQVLNASIDFSAGHYDSGFIDCSAFNGLFLVCSALGGNPANFGTINVSFQDQLGGAVQLPIYPIVYRGDLRTQVNIPVLGAQFRVVITGPAVAGTPLLTVTGHGGGGASGYNIGSNVLAWLTPGALAVNAVTSVALSMIREGPATIALSSDTQPGIAWVNVFDSLGNGNSIGGVSVSAKGFVSTNFWLPPRPAIVSIQNQGTIPDAFDAAVTLGRG